MNYFNICDFMKVNLILEKFGESCQNGSRVVLVILILTDFSMRKKVNKRKSENIFYLFCMIVSWWYACLLTLRDWAHFNTLIGGGGWSGYNISATITGKTWFFRFLHSPPFLARLFYVLLKTIPNLKAYQKNRHARQQTDQVRITYQ